MQFLIECLNLNFHFGQIEPFFCSLALYDLSKRAKISENFYFDKNPQALLSKLGKHLVRGHAPVSSVSLTKGSVGDASTMPAFSTCAHRSKSTLERDAKDACSLYRSRTTTFTSC